MNAFAQVAGCRVRAADLASADERRRIDDFIAASAEAELFHRPAWSIAVERGCRQRSHYLIAESKGGAIEGLLPLTEMRSMLFGSALVSTGFGIGGGIVADSDAAAAALAEASWSLAERLGCATVELRGGRLPSGWRQSEGVYADFVRDLPADDAAILTAIKRRQRAEVRRAQGFGLAVTAGRGARERDTHYRLYAESVRNLGTPVFPRALFDAMLEEFGDDADVLIVGKDDRPLAAVLSFYFKNTAYPYWGGGVFAARKWRANDLLYYELMRHAAARGCTRFDFGRSKLGTGAYAFKKNWGWEPKPLTYAVRTAGGGPARDVNPLSPKYRLQVAAWQRLPLWLANRLGPPIARGLG